MNQYTLTKSRFFGTVVLSTLIFSVALKVEASVIRTGDNVSISKEAVVPGDFYAAGSDILISGVVEGDVYVVGGSVTINGTVEGDVFAVGGSVAVHGTVKDDVRALGGKVVVAEVVMGDVAVAGGSVQTLSTARIAGDLLFYGGQADVEGEITGAVHARAEELSINGKTGAIDTALGGTLTFGPSARISGDVGYQSPTEFSRAPDSVIDGDVVRRSAVEQGTRTYDTLLPLWFMALFSSLVAVLLLRTALVRMFSSRGHALGMSGLLGLGAFFLTPLAFGLLLASVLGALAGIFLCMLYLALVCAAMILMHVFAGALLSHIFVKQYKVTWMWTIVGVALVQSVLLVPIVGLVTVFIFFTITLGMIVHYLFTLVRR